MKIGLIQTDRIGDLIIALPIAHWFLNRGHEVLWPINETYLDFMRLAAPEIEFIGIPTLEHCAVPEYYLHHPLSRLLAAGCDPIVCLYSYLAGSNAINQTLAKSLKFDEYKYAVAGVPFSEKWTLSSCLRRDHHREQALHDRLELAGDYICVHTTGSTVQAENAVPSEWREQFQIVEISDLTGNPFDWLYTLENASKRLLLDSAFANLTEQMNLAGENYLILRSEVAFTPVFRNSWTFMATLLPQADGANAV